MNCKIGYSRIYNIHEYNVPYEIGAYVITHTHDNICAEKYIGSTENLHKRMSGHCNKNMLYVDVYVTNDISLAESLERILMYLIKPATNSQFLYLLDKDKDLMNELLNDDIFKKNISENTIKIGCRYLKYVIRDNEFSKKNKSLIKDKNKSIHLEDDIHSSLIKIQFDLRQIEIEKTLYQINDTAIRYGIENTLEIIKNNVIKEGTINEENK